MIGNNDVDIILQKIEHRKPVFTGRFHTDITTPVFNKPVFKLQDRMVRGRGTLLLNKKVLYCKWFEVL